MRWAAVVVFAVLSAGPAWAQNGDQNGGSEIFVPPAPPLTPEAPPPPAPVQPVQPPPPPPGLVQAVPPVAPPAGNDGSTPVSPSPMPPPPSTNLPNMPPPGTNTALPNMPPAAAQPPPPDVAPVQADSWTPGTTAVLAVLNKADGSTSQLTLPVGAQAQTTGDLSVSVQACLSRPAGQIPDVAVFLTVTPVQQATAPLYNGWMVRSAPGATVVGNAGQTFRVIGCS